MAPTPRAIVVGGGLAGLVAARHLAGGGIDVTLLERDGYRFDRGFQVPFTAYPAVRRELDLEALTRRTLASWFPERRFGGLERLHTDRIEFAQFDQPPGIHERLPDARDPAGSVYLAGDYTRWSLIQGVMASGREAGDGTREPVCCMSDVFNLTDAVCRRPSIPRK